ncbi:MAG: SUMF1/EgtB/PvdO family nonheme iron enzyme [Bacteroidetes bacterium]|nr:SUMF1/EgtB/PvdO family nonheme iron enzyme [Bacteroidota bacterium]
MKKIISLFIIASLSLSHALKANNLNIANISVPSTTTIQFDISWDNSWYASVPSNNWDAVWIFVKTQVCGAGSSPWSHANLSTVSVDHSVTGGVLQVDAVTDGKGVFIRRSTFGAGSISASTVVLKLSSAFTIAGTNYEVIGIEMVNVPQGSFSVGDGSTNNTTQSTASFGTANGPTTYTVSSEAAIAQDGLRNDKAGDGAITAHAAIIAGFPKGYNAFYCMKYEISQQQYTTFLNLIDYNAQVSRTAVNPSSAVGTAALAANSGDNRNSIEIKTPGAAFSTPAVYGNDLNNNNLYDESADGGNIACNYLSWEDLKAYLDWAALRPLTELEFEKTCRGTNSALLVEYAWGSTTINAAISSSLTAGGQATEVSTSTADGLCAENGGSSTTLGPLRTGFAATSITTRTGAGASFYGIMDLGGNVWEQVFQCGYYNGSVRVSAPAFTGVMGDGALDASGNANATNWGGVSSSIVRGGNWEYAASKTQTSDRSYVNSTVENTTRIRRTGGRGGR